MSTEKLIQALKKVKSVQVNGHTPETVAEKLLDEVTEIGQRSKKMRVATYTGNSRNGLNVKLGDNVSPEDREQAAEGIDTMLNKNKRRIGIAGQLDKPASPNEEVEVALWDFRNRSPRRRAR